MKGNESPRRQEEVLSAGSKRGPYPFAPGRVDNQCDRGRRCEDLPTRSAIEQGVQQNRGMNGGPAGEMGDLQTAGKAGGDEHRVRPRLADRGEEALFADLARHLVVLLLV